MLRIPGLEQLVRPRIADTDHRAPEDVEKALALVLATATLVFRYVEPWTGGLEDSRHEVRSGLFEACGVANPDFDGLEGLQDYGLVMTVSKELTRCGLHCWVEIHNRQTPHRSRSGWHCPVPGHRDVLHIGRTYVVDYDLGREPSLNALRPMWVGHLDQIALEDGSVNVEEALLRLNMGLNFFDFRTVGVEIADDLDDWVPKCAPWPRTKLGPRWVSRPDDDVGFGMASVSTKPLTVWLLRIAPLSTPALNMGPLLAAWARGAPEELIWPPTFGQAQWRCSARGD